jgi:hypothetical protein
VTVNTHIFFFGLITLSDITGTAQADVAILDDELCSFSTFFALNFDKKLAVE